MFLHSRMHRLLLFHESLPLGFGCQSERYNGCESDRGSGLGGYSPVSVVAEASEATRRTSHRKLAVLPRTEQAASGDVVLLASRLVRQTATSRLPPEMGAAKITCASGTGAAVTCHVGYVAQSAFRGEGCANSRNAGRIFSSGPTPVEIALVWSILGRVGQKMGRRRPNLGTSWEHSANITNSGPTLTRHRSQIWAELDQIHVEVYQFWTDIGEFQPTSARSRPIWARCRLDSSRNLPTDLGQFGFGGDLGQI